MIILPLLIEKVELPGFLEGKKYGDFTNRKKYKDSLESLLTSLGDSNPIKINDNIELEKLKEEIKSFKEIANQHKSQLDQVYESNLTTKSEKARKDIEKENATRPDFAPINNVYAFEIGDITVTLGYLLHVIRKIRMKGVHVFDWTLEVADK